MRLDKQLSIGTGKYIRASICFFLEHESFQPDPIIRIYGTYLDDNNKLAKIKLKDIQIWDWYRQKADGDDRNVNFKVVDDVLTEHNANAQNSAENTDKPTTSKQHRRGKGLDKYTR